MNNDLVREGYDKVAENYSSERDQLQNDRYLDELVKLLKPGASILDLGCGAGLPVDKYFIDRGFKLTGLDLSEKQIELAKKNIPQANYEVGDISALQNGQFQVDAVVSFYAIFHTPREKHQDIIKTINSFLVDGGLLLITMGAGEWEGTEEDFHGTKMWWSHFGPEKNRQIVENAGLEVILDEIDTSAGEKHQVIMAKKQ